MLLRSSYLRRESEAQRGHTAPSDQGRLWTLRCISEALRCTPCIQPRFGGLIKSTFSLCPNLGPLRDGHRDQAKKMLIWLLIKLDWRMAWVSRQEVLRPLHFSWGWLTQPGTALPYVAGLPVRPGPVLEEQGRQHSQTYQSDHSSFSLEEQWVWVKQGLEAKDVSLMDGLCWQWACSPNIRMHA